MVSPKPGLCTFPSSSKPGSHCLPSVTTTALPCARIFCKDHAGFQKERHCYQVKYHCYQTTGTNQLQKELTQFSSEVCRDTLPCHFPLNTQCFFLLNVFSIYPSLYICFLCCCIMSVMNFHFVHCREISQSSHKCWLLFLHLIIQKQRL